MSGQVLLGVGALVLGAMVWMVGTAGLTRASLLQDFPRSRGGGRGRYVLTYVVTLLAMSVGVIVLSRQVGGWALLLLLAAFVPQLVVTAASAAAHQGRSEQVRS